MGRFRRHMYEDYLEKPSSDERYNIAYKKVKRMKGFYSHLQIYLIVNAIIIISNLNRDFFSGGAEESGLFEWNTYSTAIFWGIGLLVHGFRVFGRDIFFTDDWEEKKIQEFMKKEKINNKWE